MEKELFDFISQYMILSDAEKKVILDLNIFKKYRKGSLLLEEGKRSLESYFVLKGCIRCYYIVDGEEKTTAFYTEMEPFTPLCVVSKKPSKCYVGCVEDSILIVSNPDMEEEVFEKFPRFETLCRIFSAEILAKSRTSFDDFKTSSPEQRYLNLLKTRPDLIQRLPQYQLASYLGMKPESLSRIRRRVLLQV